MDNDRLRALADAIVYRDSLAIARAADYLRACADAQPVAWRCEVRGDGTDPKFGAVDWRHYHTTTSERDARAFVARCGNGIEGRAVPLYAHLAPAAPQAEPCIGNDPICPCQDGDACHYKDSADGTKAWPVPQSEPKRKPACLWSRADDDTDVWETKCGHAFTIIDGTPTDNQMAFCCYCGRRVDEEIGGSDAE